MKGVNFVTNNKGKKIAVQIDMKLLKKNSEHLADFFDVIIAVSREDSEDISWENAKRDLKKIKN